jgi:hypothetical protein
MDRVHPTDLFTEPSRIDPDTLRNLGPLRALAGVFEGTKGKDEHPVEAGTGEDAYVEGIELQPIDPQTNGPQLLYGLRYHTRIVRPGEVATFHDQVGYWLWEPATGDLLFTLAIPRGQVAMAMGRAAADARTFEVRSKLGDPCCGIVSAPFLDHAFRTTEFRLTVKLEADGIWSYEQDTVMQVRGRPEPFHHVDRNTLHRVAEPTLNPLARAAG